MDLLKEVKNYMEKDARTPEQQMAFLKQLLLIMITQNRLYKEHVVSFCGTLLKMYNTMSSNGKENEEIKSLS